jgi:predicted AAA+ superfamily ATPase
LGSHLELLLTRSPAEGERLLARTISEPQVSEQPVVALLGARQVGKTTLARQVVRTYGAGVAYFDLESSRDVAKLADPLLALEPLRG